MSKTYTDTQIQNEFDRLSCPKQREIMWEALDIMQAYNGRSRFLCVSMAMGYSNYEGDADTYIKNKP